MGTGRTGRDEAFTEFVHARRAQLYRVTAKGPERVYEGPGWVQALDCHGAVCAALGGTLKGSGSGSDYHLLGQWLLATVSRRNNTSGVVA